MTVHPSSCPNTDTGPPPSISVLYGRSHTFQHPNYAGGISTTSSSLGSIIHGRAHITPVELLTFSGEVEDFWEFREVFTTVVRDVYLEPALHLMQLRNHLKPGRERDMIKGITGVE